MKDRGRLERSFRHLPARSAARRRPCAGRRRRRSRAARTRRRRSPPAARAAAGKGLLGDPTAGGPVDAVGIPLARRDYPVTLPRVGDAVKARSSPRRGGELQIYNYADYLNPAVLKAFGKQEGVSVRVTTFTRSTRRSRSSPPAARSSTSSSPRPTSSRSSSARKLLAAAEPRAGPEPRARTPGRSCTARSTTSARATRSRTPSTRPGSAGATTSCDFDPRKLDQPWDAFWNARKARGRVGILDDSREALGMALMRRGVTDLNTEDPALIEQARADLEELNQHRARQGDDLRLRDAAGRAHVDAPVVVGRPDQRGHLLPAQGHDARRPLLLVPEGRRADLQRLHLRGGEGGEAGDRTPLPRLPAATTKSPTRTSPATSATSRRSRRSTPQALFDERAPARVAAQRRWSPARTTRTATPTSR